MKIPQMTICDTIYQFINEIGAYGRLIAFDIGTKRIGVALSDPTRTIASPNEVYNRINLKKDVNKAISYIKAFEATGIVVGLPLSLSGKDGDMCETVMAFVRKLAKESSVPIFLQDERFTSKLSQQIMSQYNITKAKKSIVEDKIAASFILQSAIELIK